MSDFRLERVAGKVQVYRADGGYQATITEKMLYLWERCDGFTDNDALAEALRVFGENYVYRPVVNLALHRLSEAGLLEVPMFLSAPPPRPGLRAAMRPRLPG